MPTFADLLAEEWDAGIRLGQHRLDLRFALEVYARWMVTVALRDQAAHLTASMHQQSPAEIDRTASDQLVGVQLILAPTVGS